ncbi:hypothetical protein [uncultured Vibrio sp.]|uniref:hypothetical protein n=1 Tax=uncultured Vibrio sp. TaxID=114054 RepID=UPI0026367593|nr:hypothetical protein [uncultured Vibrio sp.]
MVRKFLLLILGLIVLVGMHHFNFINNDLYVTEEDSDKVMLTLFGIKTDNNWSIKLPISQIEVRLTDIGVCGDRRFVSGDYQDGSERGSVHLDYLKIVTLNHAPLKDEESITRKGGSQTRLDDILFVVPFFVSTQGDEALAYLGLFNINIKRRDIKQLDNYFIGDGVKVVALQTEEPFDVTSRISLSYFTHDEKEALIESSTSQVTKLIKVTNKAFSQ